MTIPRWSVVLALSLATFGRAMPVSLLVKAHAMSLATGLTAPAIVGTDYSTFNARVLDIGIGIRVAPRYAIALNVIPWDGIISRYENWPDWPPLSAGVTVLRSAPLSKSPRGLVLTASARGSNAWGLGYSLRYLDLSVGANATFWVINPELEVGWRREWRPTSSIWQQDPPLYDCAFVMVRIGLGGWYEIDLVR